MLIEILVTSLKWNKVYQPVHDYETAVKILTERIIIDDNYQAGINITMMTIEEEKEKYERLHR